ncbi:MAG TPA: hypothetical protein VN455_02645 [Methanotrichaceae archaeon]|nr:hypothetical protein [Methanotrichaceae archaeon]
MPVSSGYISIHNSYFTNGATVRDNTELNDIDYTNVVDIDRLDISLTGAGWSEGNQSSIDNQIAIDSNDDTLTGRVDAAGEEVALRKDISAGEKNELGIAYSIDSGQSLARTSNMDALAVQSLALKNISYTGSLASSLQSLKLGGKVLRVPAGENDSIDTSLKDDLLLKHLNKWSYIESSLNSWWNRTTPKNSDDLAMAPIYRFDDLVTSNGTEKSADIGVELNVVAGDRDTDVSLNGRSSWLMPKTVGPIHIEPIPMGDEFQTLDMDKIANMKITERLYMSYLLQG